MNSKKIVMVAGEASGDMHGANVVRELKRQDPHLYICGIGSRAMRSAGVKILVDSAQLAVVGITEAFAKTPKLLKVRSRLKKLFYSLKPDLLILIDFPDFNLHIAGIAKRLGIPILYYISPQIWAWRAGRVKKIKAFVDHMAVILPFEVDFYRRHDVPVTFVGHPLMDNFSDFDDRYEKKKNTINKPVIGIFPGSRAREVSGLLPTMLQSAQLLQEQLDGAQFVVSCASSADRDFINNTIAKYNIDRIKVSTAPVKNLFTECHLAIVASGTVTLEAAICGTPMIITYAVSPVSYWLGRILINVEHIGLVNLIAQKRIVPELVQRQVTADRIAFAANKVLSNEHEYQKTCDALFAVRQKLGSPGAAKKVAQIVFNLMSGSTKMIEAH